MRRGDDSVNIHLEGYESSKYAEADFLRVTDSTGVPADLSQSQVTSTPQLQNALAYFGPEIDEVSVRMPLSEGYSLFDSLDSFWNADAEARRNESGDKVFEFDTVQFTTIIIYYD